jgi:hypothetical protein
MASGMVLPWLGVVIGTGLGLLGLIAPRRALAFVGLQVGSPEGRAEVRATYGGLFIGLEVGAAVLWQTAGRTEPLGVIGIAWLGAAMGRVVSLAVDGRRTAKNVAGIGFEAVLGLVHLSVWL